MLKTNLINSKEMKTLRIIPPFFWYGIRQKIKKLLEEEEAVKDKKSSLKHNLLRRYTETSSLIVEHIKETLKEQRFLKGWKFYITRENLRNDIPLSIGRVTEEVLRSICRTDINQKSLQDFKNSVVDIVIRSITNFTTP